MSARHCDVGAAAHVLLAVRLPRLTGADGKSVVWAVAEGPVGATDARAAPVMQRRWEISGGSQGRTWPQAEKIPIVATSTEVVDWMFHWEPRVAYPYRASRAEPKKPSTCSGVKPSHMSACSARIHS